jgi:hypothetical protein
MKYNLMIRARPLESIAERHGRLVSALETLEGDWALQSKIPKPKEPNKTHREETNLAKCFAKGIKVAVSYQNRKYHVDESQYDDYFDLEFDPDKFDYAVLALDYFDRIADAFHAYRGQIGDAEFMPKDFPKAVKSEAKRNGIYRIYPVCFFDTELISRSFQMSTNDVARRIHKSVERVTVGSGGVSIVVSSQVLSLKEADSLGKDIRKLLA